MTDTGEGPSDDPGVGRHQEQTVPARARPDPGPDARASG